MTIDGLWGDPDQFYTSVCQYFDRLTALNPPFILQLSVLQHPPLSYVRLQAASQKRPRAPRPTADLDLRPLHIPAAAQFHAAREDAALSLRATLLRLPADSPFAACRAAAASRPATRLRSPRAALLCLRYANQSASRAASRSKPLLRDGAACGLTQLLLRFAHWERYGLRLRRPREVDAAMVFSAPAGDEAAAQPLLLLLLHLQSTKPIRFTSLQKTAVQADARLDRLGREVRMRLAAHLVPQGAAQTARRAVSHGIHLEATGTASRRVDAVFSSFACIEKACHR